MPRLTCRPVAPEMEPFPRILTPLWRKLACSKGSDARLIAPRLRRNATPGEDCRRARYSPCRAWAGATGGETTRWPRPRREVRHRTPRSRGQLDNALSRPFRSQNPRPAICMDIHPLLTSIPATILSVVSCAPLPAGVSGPAQASIGTRKTKVKAGGPASARSLDQSGNDPPSRGSAP